MAEPFYVPILRIVHVGGGWVAFGLGPIALATLKGSRRHVWVGRGFLLGMTSGITAGLALAVIDRAPDLFLFGLLALFLLGTGYLAPRIGRGSSRAYRWDRALTGVGAFGVLGWIVHGLADGMPPRSDLAVAGLGLGIVLSHALWRGPRDPLRWQGEHLTSLLGAYTILWNFILALYLPALSKAIGPAVPVLSLIAIVWARRRLGRAAIDPASAVPSLTGVA